MKFLWIALLVSVTSVCSAQHFTVKEISFEGLKRVDESLLRRLIKVRVARPYDSLQVGTDLERLNRLPAIAKASVVKIINEDSTYTLRYKIIENFAIIPGLRIGQANDDSFAFRASVFDFNFLGQSQIIGGFYQKDVFSSFGAYWEAPFMFSNKWGLGLNYIDNITFEPVYFQDEVFNYKKEDRGLEMYILYEIDFHNKAELGVRFFDESYVYNETPAAENLPNDLNANKTFYRAQYETNFLDIDYQYVVGFRNIFDVSYQTGGDGLLGDTFIATNSFEYFKKLGDKGNWANRLQLGYSSFTKTEFAPFTIDNQLNLRGAGNDSNRGTSYAFLNTEYRYTLLEKDWFVLQGNAFVDVGSLKEPKGSISDNSPKSPFELYSGIGIRGLHKRIFNAVIRLDYGVGLNARKSHGFVFGIGQYF